MKIIKVTQGTPEWHAHRATHFNASDAPAMMGCSTHKTRTQLLHERHTGQTPDVDASTQRRFDDGHRFEALARPLAEAIVGEDLYPVTGSSGKLSASFDGMTADDSIAFEHKTLNAELRDWFANYDQSDLQNRQNNGGSQLPMMYRVQMEHQCMVSGAGHVLFMASRWNDDTLDEVSHCWYAADPELLKAIGAGWNQFEIDLAAYVPSVIVERPKAAVTLALPALFIQAKGEITTSNMQEYGDALAARLKFVRAIALVTDQNFADAKDAAKLLRENIESAKLAKDAMLAQTVTVGEAARMIDAWCEDMRLTALQLEKDVLREDLAKKAAMIAATKLLYGDYISALMVELAPYRVNVVAPVFADAIKNKRSFANMQDGLDTMLANAKIAADAAASLMRTNKSYFAEHAKGHESLFADKADLMQKPLDYVMLVIASRISDHIKVEAAKEEATRQVIRAEEQAKAELEARALVAREALEAMRLADVPAFSTAKVEPAPVFIAPAAINIVAAADNVVTLVRPAATAPAGLPLTPPALKLGQIAERLGFTLSADFLRTLGFEPAGREKGAVLFHESSFSMICASLVAHIEAVQTKAAA